ncbi:thioredoxin fold domain-containing protein [Niveispirillum sp. SYP-B3756]|nr:thioredoxin fold domain-containing protein [Niveispirillum sp. SYP-B3756]
MASRFAASRGNPWMSALASPPFASTPCWLAVGGADRLPACYPINGAKTSPQSITQHRQERTAMSTIKTIGDDDFAALEAQTGDAPLLLIFSAIWCGPCKAMAPTLEDIADVYTPSVAFARIDIEQAPGLAEKFGVRTVPTLVLRRGGQDKLRHVGVLTRTKLAAMMDEACQEPQA